MDYIKINLKNLEKKQIDLIVDYLNRGKIIVYPTDTIYGLGCLATGKKAINRIYKIKKRGKTKPLLILVKSWRMLKKYCFVNKKQDTYLRTAWPGPVSVILKSRGLLPKELTGGSTGIAVRLPKNDFLIKIIRGINKPLVSTSLNISGEKPLRNLSKLNDYFKGHKPDLIIDAGRVKSLKPSRLVDLRDVNNIKVLRDK